VISINDIIQQIPLGPNEAKEKKARAGQGNGSPNEKYN
jgi:hypothetical protein